MEAAKFIALPVNNCEHFAYYVLYGLNFVFSQAVIFGGKGLGAEVISKLQPRSRERRQLSVFYEAADLLRAAE